MQSGDVAIPHRMLLATTCADFISSTSDCKLPSAVEISSTEDWRLCC